LTEPVDYLPEVATAQQLAEVLCCTVQNVRQHADQGHIDRAPGRRGRYLFLPSLRKYVGHLRAMAARRADPGGIEVLSRERANLAHNQAEVAALKAAQLRGDLVPAVEVEARWRRDLTALRSRLLAVPSRIRTRQPHLSRDEIQAVEDEIRAALEELAGDP
jgi:phage terminase Nu1 subunit (DNA packaging protein)